MHIHRRMTMLTCLGIALLLLTTGCGSSSSSSPAAITSPGSVYLVEYVPGPVDAMEGKTTFQLRVRKKSDGSAATGLAIMLAPIMHMSTKSHGTPVDIVTETGTPGTYDCTVYYLMADHSSMGMIMGYWELQVRIGTEIATFYPTVEPQMMGADTWKTTMKSSADVMMGNMYFLFSDGMVSAASPTFKLYLSRSDDMSMMTFRPISAVSGPSGTVASVVVTASTDTAFSFAVNASDDKDGHFSMPMSALSTTVTHTVYVKLTVNGEVKTSDGLATNATGTNLYQTFKVTSH